ncbi:MAG: ABC transporter permease [Bacteroidia bacterium]|nr:ABC transporter permease [Bacteroidia bacterium]HQV00273.1 ABC transporter permease [Bacteroidia bacterium]
MKSYSQTKAMLAISKASLQSIMRSPSAVVFTLAFPLVFILVFGFIGSGNIELVVAVMPQTQTNNLFYQTLETDSNVIKLHKNYSTQQIKKELEKGTLDAALAIAENTDGTLQIQIQTSAASPDKGKLFGTIAGSIIDKINVSALQTKPAIQLSQTEVSGRPYKRIDFILPGQLGFSILSTGVFGVAFVFFNLRQTLVIKRFFATPIKRIYIILGEALARIVFALMGAAFIILIGWAAFGFTLINGLLTFLTMLLLAALGLIVFMGFGFIVSGVAKNESTIPPFANMITLPQFLLSGTFFSISALPVWLQPICKLLPLTFLNDALRLVAFDGASLIEVLPQITGLTIWGLLVYMGAARLFRWE